MAFKEPIENKREDGVYTFTENEVDLFAIAVINPDSEYLICGAEGGERFPTFLEAMFLADKFWDKDDHILIPLDRKVVEGNLLKMIRVHAASHED